MKRFLAVALILCGFCRASFAVILFFVDAPQDDLPSRASIAIRPELIPFHTDYTNFVQTRVWSLKFSEMEKIFGPKLETATNWWGMDKNETSSGPRLAHHPADIVLPLVLSGNSTNCGGKIMMMVSGLHFPTPAENKSHTDLYAVGDIGYLELYSQLDGEGVQNALFYFRTAAAFVPLKSTNDFTARLEWEKNKFKALKSWFDKHVPPAQK